MPRPTYAPTLVRPSGSVAGAPHGFLDLSVPLSVGGTQTGPSPWVAVAGIAALLTGTVAVLNYLDKRKDRR